MRKKKSIIGISMVAVLFMALTGCGKTNDEVAQEPINNIDDNNVVQPIEAPEEPVEPKQVSFNDIWGDEIPSAQIKYAPVSGLKANLSYVGENDINAQNYTSEELTTVLNLENGIFAALYDKNGASTHMNLKNDYLTMYATKQTTNGNMLTISIADGCEIESIAIDFVSGYSSTAQVLVEGSPVAIIDGACSINASAFTLFNNNSNVNANTQVRFRSIEITYTGPKASEVISGLSTRSSLSYYYTKQVNAINDILDRAATGRTAANSYGTWTNDEFVSEVSYSGISAGGNTSIQLTDGSNAGIVVTSNTNNYVTKNIVIDWNSNTNSARKIDIYGKDTPYSSASDLHDEGTRGTLLKTAAYANRDPETGKSTIAISGLYKYIGIKSNNGAMYLNSIDIEWDEITFAYSNTAIRFGAFIKAPLLERLDTESDIQGYGVMLSTESYIGASSIETKYNEAKVGETTIDEAITTICAGNNIKNFYKSGTPVSATAEQKGSLLGNYYIWNLYKDISSENLSVPFNAVAYIRVDGEIIFLDEITESAKSLAQHYIGETSYDDDPYEGSAYNLANL